MKLHRAWVGLTAVFGLAAAGCGAPTAGGRPASARADAPLRFEDVTQQAGIGWERTNGASPRKWLPETMGGGGAFLDYDRDGFLDVLLVNGLPWPQDRKAGDLLPTCALYRGSESGRFADVSRQTGVDLSLQGMGACVGDYDGDGWDDVLLTAVGASRLLRNVPVPGGGRRFRDVTAETGLDDRGWATSAAWVDYDRDGWLDLFVCHYVRWAPELETACGISARAYCRPQMFSGESSRLYRNVRGRFRDVTRQAGVYSPTTKALGICVVDVNDDAYPDLVVASDTEPNLLYVNRKNGTFSEEGLERGIAVDENGRARAGMGIDAVDYDNRGVQGLAIGNFTFDGLAFYDLTTEIPYENVARRNGVFPPSYPRLTFGLFFADFDLDTRPDLLATNGHVEDTIDLMNPGLGYAEPCLLYHNLGGGLFREVSQSAGEGVSRPMVGRGACRGDFDRDGRPDVLLIPVAGPVRLLRNVTPPRGQSFSLRLEGRAPNRDAYGARVAVTAEGVRQVRELRSGTSYLSSHENRLLFGLPDSAVTAQLEIRWPSGEVQAWEVREPGRRFAVREGEPTLLAE